MKKSYIWATGLTILVALWVYSGQFNNEANDLTSSTNITEEDENFLVRVETKRAMPYTREITISGYTEALRLVQLKSEIEAPVLRTPVEKGVRVTKGTVICELESYDRIANLAQSRALAAQRKLEFEAATELRKKGHKSETQVATAKAFFEAAIAQVKRAEVQLGHTKITAPFDGLVEDRQAEVGAFLKKGEACATLMFEDPFLAVGEVSDKDVLHINMGTEAKVEFENGPALTGLVRYISHSARSETRTFKVEIELNNPDKTLKDGLSAQIKIPVDSGDAHLLEPSTLVLKDNGLVGVRGVIENKVVFMETKIIGDDNRGIWVSGLPEVFDLITVGQEFVTEGQNVRVSYETSTATASSSGQPALEE